MPMGCEVGALLSLFGAQGWDASLTSCTCVWPLSVRPSLSAAKQAKKQIWPWKCDVPQWEPLQRNLLSHQFCCLICSLTFADFGAKKNFLINSFSMEREGVGKLEGAHLQSLVPINTLGCADTLCCPQLRQGKQHSSKWLFFETFLCRSWFTEKTILSRGIRVLVLHQPLIFSLLPLLPVIVFPLCTDSKLELGVRGSN